MTKKRLIIIIIVLVLVGFGYYTISPLFRVVEVNDALPENILPMAPVAEMEVMEEEVLPPDPVAATDDEESESVVDESIEEPVLEGGEPMPDESEVAELPSTSDPADETSMPTELPAAPMMPPKNDVMPTTGHPAEGTVQVLRTPTDTIIRYEDFETINGPRLHVYLANDLDADDFVDLGPIKGTKGNINYTVPAEIDVDDYKYVMYWCVPFGVLFNYAELN